MRVSFLARQDFDVFLDGDASVEDGSSDVGHERAESVIFGSDLVGELTRVAHDKDGALAIDGIELLKGGEDKDCRLSHSRLCLAENIGSENGLRDANLLNWNREMSESFGQMFVASSRKRSQHRATEAETGRQAGGRAGRQAAAVVSVTVMVTAMASVVVAAVAVVADTEAEGGSGYGLVHLSVHPGVVVSVPLQAGISSQAA